MSEEDMQEIFGEQGEVERVSMVRDKATGKLKAYCFIQFADEDTTDKCVCKCPSSLGLQRYAHLTIRYVSRYRGHDTIRIAIHHKLFALLGTQILNKENTRNYAKFT